MVIWIKGTSYLVGQAVTKQAPDGNKYIYEVTTAGTSGPNEPTWPIAGTVSDGSSGPQWATVVGKQTVDAGVTWVNVGQPSWSPHTAYALGDFVMDTTPARNVQIALNSGMSGVGTPAWSSVLGGTIVDNSMMWDCQLRRAWQPGHTYLIDNAIVDPNGNIQQALNGGVSSTIGPNVIWTNRGLLASSTFAINYAAIVGPGGPVQKFDGSVVTHVGISAPTVQTEVGVKTFASIAARGVPIQFGRLYAWTWFNPNTLAESSPSPLTGPVSFFATDLQANITKQGCLLPPSPTDEVYSSVFVGLPPASTLNSPAVGDGFTNVRFYATRDGGSVLFLVQTMYDALGNVITDGNSSVPITSLVSASDYLPLAITQSKTTLVGAYDGAPGSSSQSVDDSIDANDGEIQGTTPSAISPQSPGIVPSDTDSSAIFDGTSGYISTTVQAAAPTTGSVFLVFETVTSLGGPLASYTVAQIGPAGGQSDRSLFIDNNGHLCFAFKVGGVWHILSYTGTAYNDGAPHDVLVAWGGGSTTMFVDGASVATVALVPNTTYQGYWRIGGNVPVSRFAAELGFTGHPVTDNYFAGTLAKVAIFNAALVVADDVALHAAGLGGGGTLDATIEAYGSAIYYWRLNDIANPTSTTVDASLVLPGPLFGQNNPPSLNPIWATIYQGSLYIVNADNKIRVDYSQPEFFEAFGIDNYLLFPDETDSPITALIGTIDRLIVGTTRGLQQIVGSTPATFARFPIDRYHGIVGKQVAIAAGSQLIALIAQGIVSVNMSLSSIQEPSTDHVSIGFSPLSLIGNDVQPITEDLDPLGYAEIDAAIYDTTANRVLFLFRSLNVQS